MVKAKNGKILAKKKDKTKTEPEAEPDVKKNKVLNQLKRSPCIYMGEIFVMFSELLKLQKTKVSSRFS